MIESIYKKCRAFVLRFPRQIAAVVVLLFVAWLLGALYRWQPERQVQLRFEQWVQAVGDRNWNRVGSLVHPDYSDQWGFDKETMLREAREAMRHFFAPVVTAEDVAIQTTDYSGEVRCRFTIQGDGTSIATTIRHELNSRRPEFVLHWDRPDWRPWHWQIISIESNDIALDRYRGF